MKLPVNEVKQRVFRFQQSLNQSGIEGALLVQRTDTIYYSGTAQNIHMYIPAQGDPVVLVYRDFDRAQKESPWNVIKLTGISKIPQLIKETGLPVPESLGLEFDVLPVSNYERYRKAFSNTHFLDISKLVRMQRAVKSNWELQQIEEAGRIYTRLLDYAQEVLRSGMTEVEFELRMEAEARMLGHEGFVRMRGFGSEFHWAGITSGPRAAIGGYFDGPVTGQGISLEHPQGASKAEIREGEPVFLDVSIVVHGYQIDQTRILALGYLPDEMLEAHQTALEIEDRVRQLLVPGRVAGEIYEEIIHWVEKETPYAGNFMGYAQGRVSFVGHGVGLELDEMPTISRGAKEVLSEGMVIALEPKFVFPGIGAIGIEDSVVVEGEQGARFLCNSDRQPKIIRV